MKKLILLIMLTVYFSTAFNQSQKTKFNPSNLTEEEIQDCQNFKNKKGQVRYDEFQKIKHIFPYSEVSLDSTKTIFTVKEETVNFIMTKSQLLQLIGKPDFEDGAYELGLKRYDCEVTFVINEENIVLTFGYANCNKYRKE